MFYLPLAIITLAVAPVVLDIRRLADLAVYGLLASVLATIHDRWVLLYHLWEYRDTGLVDNHTEIAMLISLSAAPVFAMRFVQGMTPAGGVPWRRMVKFTAISMLPELVGLYSGHIVYHQWWTASYSVLAYFPIWLTLWAFSRWWNGSVAGKTDGARTL